MKFLALILYLFVPKIFNFIKNLYIERDRFKDNLFFSGKFL